MQYNWLKSIHVFSASIVFGFGVMLTLLLVFSYKQHIKALFATAIDLTIKLNWLVILPAGIVQLLTGFSLFGINHYSMAHLWVKFVTIGFFVSILCWLSMMYCLQQCRYAFKTSAGDFTVGIQTAFKRFLITAVMTMCVVFSIIFMMAGKIG